MRDALGKEPETPGQRGEQRRGPRSFASSRGPGRLRPVTPGRFDDERVVVACAADEEYAMPLAAMLASLSERIDPARAVSVYVLDGGLTAESRGRLAQSLQKDTVELCWVDVESSALESLPVWGRMSATTYTRLLLPVLLPPSIDRVIWLDCDLIVHADLAALWSCPLEGSQALAVQDMIVPYVSYPDGIAHYAALGLERQAGYFNAGVMLVNLERWRTDDVPTRVLDYLHTYREDIVYWDQEGLNAVLAGDWGALDPRWNQNAGVAGRSYYRPEHLDGETYRRVVEDPWIIHFSGNLKPWMLHDTSDPARALYFDYLDLTPWAGWRPRRTLWSSIVGRYETSGLRNLLYPAEKRGLMLVRRWGLWRTREARTRRVA